MIHVFGLGGIINAASQQAQSQAQAVQQAQAQMNQIASIQQQSYGQLAISNPSMHGTLSIPQPQTPPARRCFYFDGQVHDLLEDDYNYIIRTGLQALKKRETFKEDFDEILK
jgi:hypothetical protein